MRGAGECYTAGNLAPGLHPLLLAVLLPAALLTGLQPVTGIPPIATTPLSAQEAPEAAESAAEVERRCRVRVVEGPEIEEVIRGLEGYDVTAAPNEGRFMADLLFRLVERHRTRGADDRPLRIRQEEFFSAFLRATELTSEEAPAAFRMSRRFGQTIVVEHRRDRVINEVEAGPEPRRALAVRVEWPDTGDVPDRYTYEDTLSDPHLRLRHEREITYRLLDYDSLVVYDAMEGISGRPTSGALGALFAVLGMTGFLESRYAVADDGTQLTYTRVKKLFTFDAVATVSPEGRAERGVPDDRPDLEALRPRVEADLEVRYAREPPPVCPPLTPSPAAR